MPPAAKNTCQGQNNKLQPNANRVWEQVRGRVGEYKEVNWVLAQKLGASTIGFLAEGSGWCNIAHKPDSTSLPQLWWQSIDKSSAPINSSKPGNLTHQTEALDLPLCVVAIQYFLPIESNGRCYGSAASYKIALLLQGMSVTEVLRTTPWMVRVQIHGR